MFRIASLLSFVLPLFLTVTARPQAVPAESDSIQILYYDNGAKKAEYPFKNGLKEGPAIMWDERGNKLSEGLYRAGVREGMFLNYYESGKKRMEFPFVHGVMEGVRIEWYESGAKRGEALYKAGRAQGCSIEWFESGEKLCEQYYQDGVLLHGAIFNKAGFQVGRLLPVGSESLIIPQSASPPEDRR